MKKPKIGKTPIVGGKDDGARKSVKGQVSAKLPQNRMARQSRMKRMARMEKSDIPV